MTPERRRLLIPCSFQLWRARSTVIWFALGRRPELPLGAEWLEALR